jgi:perosamine synthetase
LTFAATLNAVLYAGATPVIVDIDPNSWCLDPEAAEAAITPKTKAIIPVHLYGQPADMDAFLHLREKYAVRIIEDAAEAHGAKYKGRTVGGIGDINTFSFYGNKIMTTGEGGICVSNDEGLIESMRVMRDHGMNKQKRYWHDVLGYNYRMTNLQAAIGCAQLERIDDLISNKTSIEQLYKEKLGHLPFVHFQRDYSPERQKVNWITSVLLDEERKSVIELSLKNHRIDFRNFFYPMSSMPLYKKYIRTKMIHSLEVSRRGISLPTHDKVDFDRVHQAFTQ